MSLYDNHPALVPKFWSQAPQWSEEDKDFRSIEHLSRKKKLDRAFKKMTSDEQMTLACYSLNGYTMFDGEGRGTIYMGMSALERLRNFEDEMIRKYEHPG